MKEWGRDEKVAVSVLGSGRAEAGVEGRGAGKRASWQRDGQVEITGLTRHHCRSGGWLPPAWRPSRFPGPAPGLAARRHNHRAVFG